MTIKNPVDTQILFFAKFGAMLANGVPLVKSLVLLSDEDFPAPFKKILKKVTDRVVGGMVFSQALAEHPTFFDKKVLELVAGGEKAGALDFVSPAVVQFILFSWLSGVKKKK